jgi:putative membrane-bound dehydrogenase-like protein
MHIAKTAALLLLLLISTHAEDPLPQIERLQTSPVLRGLVRNELPNPRTPAEQTLAQMYVRDGFRAEVVVAEPDLHQPVAFTFDERGRIWAVEAYSYPQKRAEGQGLDKIVIFEDSDGDGKFETRKVFAEGLNLVSGIELGFGGVWVGAAPQMLFIADKNHDDKPDGPPEVLLDGFGYQDTHECLNSFMWGPDGWLYGNQGVFNSAKIGKPGTPDNKRTELRAGVWRYHPTRHEFEIFAEGGSNQWGLDYDEHGEIFMTHCRSYWGRGGITHVLQGGIFWNQANANYPPFIIAEAPRDYPDFRNYLLASARHDHGAGGAGARGTDAIYGGHSHVGTMIYYGDNWPDEYRGHLFTHNLGGHQINHEINRPLGSGFETVHAEHDLSFCADPKFVAVDLQYGPDGAVYMIDWYDQQHCHNPNTERWDRSNGRIYRIEYASTYKQRKVDLGSMSDEGLVANLEHKNKWFARTSERLLQERAQTRPINSAALQNLRPANWENLALLRRVGKVEGLELQRALESSDEYLRAWAIRFASEDHRPSITIQEKLVLLAQNDPSPIVRRYLASAARRLPAETAWPLLEALNMHTEDRDDRNIPLLIWQALAPRMTNDLDRAFALAAHTKFPKMADWIYWYAGTFGGSALDRVISHIAESQPATQARLLALLELSLTTRANLAAPRDWSSLAQKLYASDNPAVVKRAELIAGVFGDESRFPRLRDQLKQRDSSARQHAFAVLSKAQDRQSLSAFIDLLNDKTFRSAVIPVLARFDSPQVSDALITRLTDFPLDDRNAAINALTGRPSFAKALLDAVAEGRVKRDYLTAFNIRQLSELRDSEIDQRVAKTWGRISTTPGEKQTQIAALEKTFNEAPLWAYDGGAGREHFQKLCAQCHHLGNDGNRIGPELTGAGKNGIRYFLENIIDPNAVIGTDFQMTTVETKDGDVFSGLLLRESADALTIRTVASEENLAKNTIARRSTSDKSLMPEGLLESLGQRERIELLKYLTTH